MKKCVGELCMWKNGWACGKNGWAPYGKKGVDGRSKWRARTRETEVRLVGWCEGGLGQQRNMMVEAARNKKNGKSGEPWYTCN